MIRDLNGRPIPAGRIKHEWVANFAEGVLPSWLEVTGTATFSHSFVPISANPGGWIQLDSSGANGDRVHLGPTFDVHLNNIEEIRMDVEGLVLSAQTQANIHPMFRMERNSGDGAGPFGGANLEHSDTLGPCVRVRTTANSQVNHLLPNAAWSTTLGARNLGFVLRPREAMAYMVMDDQVQAAVDMSPDFSGNALIRPQFRLVTRGGAARWARMNQMRLSIARN